MKSAYFVIADISGYTKLVSEIEIEHATGILNELFKTIVPEFKSPMAISGYRGDAVFAYSIDTDLTSKQYLLDLIERIYCKFCQIRDRIGFNSKCQCNGCAGAAELDLKFIVHFGEYLEQDAVGYKELTGPEVIKAFRLLKNSVKKKLGTDAYALITEAARRQMDLDTFFAGAERLTETYEHLGDVECIIHRLDGVWEVRKNAEQTRVAQSSPQLIDEVVTEVPISADTAFTFCARPDLRTTYLAATRLDLPGGANQRVDQGTIYNCHHGDQLFVFEIVDWRPGEYLTGRYVLPFGMSLLETTEFTPIGSGTRVRVRVSKPLGGNLVGKLMKALVTRKLSKIFAENYIGHMERLCSIAKAYQESHADPGSAPDIATLDLEALLGRQLQTES